MELSSYIVWNIVLTLVVAPVLYAIRTNSTELKRLDILINKTREEMAKDYVSRDTFEYDITLLPIDDYMKTKKRYKVHLVLGRNEVLRDDDKIIDLKGLKTEKKIVDKFFGETNLMSSLIILKNEISKI